MFWTWTLAAAAPPSLDASAPDPSVFWADQQLDDVADDALDDEGPDALDRAWLAGTEPRDDGLPTAPPVHASRLARAVLPQVGVLLQHQRQGRLRRSAAGAASADPLALPAGASARRSGLWTVGVTLRWSPPPRPSRAWTAGRTQWRFDERRRASLSAARGRLEHAEARVHQVDATQPVEVARARLQHLRARADLEALRSSPAPVGVGATRRLR